MMAAGWVKLDRQIQTSWLWEEKPFSYGQAWIDLILTANHRAEKLFLDGDLITVERGDKVTSLRRLSDRWGWSVSKVSRFLDLLEQDGMIVQKRDTKKTVLTLVNYGKYQGQRDSKKTGSEHDRNTVVTRSKTNKNNKEYIKNEEEGARASGAKTLERPTGEKSIFERMRE